MAYIGPIGSTVAFQGTVPFSVIGMTTGSIISVNQGSIAAVIVGGSIAASFTPPANQSVSGTVHVDNFSSVVAYQLAGSILATSATVNPAANQSVSGTVGASIIGLPPVNVTNTVTVVSSLAGGIFPVAGSVSAVVTNFPTTQNVSGSVVAFQGGTPWAQTNVGSIITTSQGSIATVIIGGSIAASFTPPANQSVSGTVQTQVQASVAVVIIGGSILTSSTANQSVSGTVVTNQGTTPWVVVGSVYQGVGWSGSVAATVTNTVTVVSSLAGGIFPVSGSVSAVVTNFPTNQNVSGSVVAFQGSAPWANTNVGSVITVGQGSIAVNIIAGSISATFTPPANQSVSGTVGASIIGLPPVNVTNTNLNVGGSVIAFQGGTQITSIAGNVVVQGLNAPVASITGNPVYTGGSDGNGSVAAFKLGAGREQIITGSIQGTVSVLGTVPVTQSGAWSTSIIGGASVYQTGTWSTSVMTNVITSIATAGQVMGSVAALQATNPWNVAGSVAAFQAGTIITSVAGTVIIGSIVGTYGEDVPSTAADKGLFTLGIRNDTVASLVGTDLDYTGWSTDSAGRHLVKPFAADEVRLDTVSSVVGTSVTALFSSVTGLRNYVTDVWVANTGAAATLVTFKDGSTSVLGFTIAPAGGGSNLVGLNFPMRTAPAQDFTYVATTATSVLYVTAKGYKGP